MLNHRQFTFRLIQKRIIRIIRIITIALQLGKRKKKDKLQIKEEDDCVQKHPVGGSAGRIADGWGRPHYSVSSSGPYSARSHPLLGKISSTTRLDLIHYSARSHPLLG
jgi:hypothetical protein